MSDASTAVIAVIGLGYVGLPLGAESAKHRHVIGLDIIAERIAELAAGRNRTRELSPERHAEARHLTLTANPADLEAATIFIVSVPAPIDAHKRPNLTPLLIGTENAARAFKPGGLPTYKSTVYPGATEDECRPLLEQVLGLIVNVDFFCG